MVFFKNVTIEPQTVYTVYLDGRSIGNIVSKKSFEDYINVKEEELKNAVKHVSEKLGKDFNSMDELIAYRKEARDAKNWDIADKIRIALDEVNIVLKDSKEGTTWEVK